MPTQTLEPTSAADVDPRIQARRDEVERAGHRRRRRWRFAILGALALVAAAWFVTRTALLDVDRLEVEGASHLDPEAVRTASGVVVGDPLLDVDEGDVRARLQELRASPSASPWR
jgi:cell division septal protein FtsQ